jgi:hypothetical protein
MTVAETIDQFLAELQKDIKGEDQRGISMAGRVRKRSIRIRP